MLDLEQSSNGRGRTPLVVSGVAVGLVGAAIDVASDLPLQASRFHHPQIYVEVVLVLVGVLAAGYLVGSGALRAVRPALVGPHLAMGAAAALCVFGLRHHVPIPGGFSSLNVVLVRVGVSASAGLFLWLLAARLQRRSEAWRGFLARMPLVFGSYSLTFLIFFWLTEFGFRDAAKAQPAILAVAWLAVVLGVSFAVTRGLVLGKTHVALIGVAALFMISLSTRFFAEEFVVLDSQVIGAAEPKVKNVILIVVDTLRADALRAYNPDAAPSLGFDDFAQESFLFENAIAPASWTYPSMISIMTGVRPYHVNAEPYSKLPDGDPVTGVRLTTLAGFMTRAGYYSRGILGNNLLYRPTLVTAGLAEIDTYTRAASGHGFAARLAARISPDRYLSGSHTERVTDEAIGHLRSSSDQSNFLWMHYYDPHDEYAPPKEYVSDQAMDRVWTYTEEDRGDSDAERARAKMLYDGEVRWVGASLERLFAELKSLGVYDDSLIILTSDHGEEFWEHGDMYHGSSLYHELLHVPLMIRLPQQREGFRISSPVSTRAILPTVLDVGEIETDDVNPGWARSLAPVMESVARGQGEAGLPDDPVVGFGVFRGSHRSAVAVYLDGLKYIIHVSAEDDQVFDLSRDPTEQNNIIAEAPDGLDEARAVAEGHRLWVEEFRERYGLDGAGGEGGSSTFTDRLKSLGYIQ